MAIHNIAGFEDVAGLHVRIPNPSAYVMQKVLIRNDRHRESLAKDCYYIYEVSVLFRQAMDDLHEEFQAIRNRFSRKWSMDFKSSFQRLFAEETLEGSTSAVRVHGSANAAMEGKTQVTPEMVCRSVQKLIEAMCP